MNNIILKMTGKIKSREGTEGPPRETEIFKLNPSREQLILGQTKWKAVCPGTLNVRLDKNYADELETLEPSFTEPSVKYPDKYKNIPKRKGKYLYYNAQLNGYAVLLRNTQRGSGKTIAIIANCNLKLNLKLKDNDKISLIATSEKKIRRSLFFDKDKNPIAFENLYKDAHVFLISGGPSFKDFSHKNKLRFVMTCAINNSAKALMPYCRPNLWVCVDGPDKFLYTLWNDPQTLKLVPESHPKKMLWNNDIKLPDEKKVKDCPNVICWKRNNNFNKNTYLTEDTVNWGNNSEYVAENGMNGKRSVFISTIKILYALGFRHVYLFGVDFKMTEGGQNYSFDQNRKRSSVRGNNASYKQMEYWFNQLQPTFLKNKFYIYNLNPDSGLKAFPYLPFDEAYELALGFVHDTEKYISGELEDTANLYETRVWKCSKCNLWQRMEERKEKDDKGEYHVSTTGCSDCGKILSTRDKERKG